MNGLDSKPGRATARPSLASFNWNVSLRGIFETFCGISSFVFVNFALSLGVQKEHLGFIAAIASLACLLQMPGLFVTNSIQDRKRFVIRLSLAEPILLLIAVLCLPFLPAALRPAALVLAVFTAVGTLHLTRPTTDEWLASAIPGTIRGRYLGRRVQIISITIVISMIAAGHLTQAVDRQNPVPLALLMAVGALFGILSVLALRRASMPALSGMGAIRLADVPEIARCRPFVFCMAILMVYNVSLYLGMPYYQVFYLRVMHMRESTIAYMIGSYYVIKVLVSPFIGRLQDRTSPRTLIAWITPIYALFFASFVFSGPDRYWPVWAAWVITGLADAVFFIAITSMLYASVPHTPARKAYFAVHNLLSFGSAAAGAALAAWMLSAMREAHLVVGPFTFGQFHLFYGLCGILFIPTSIAAIFMVPAARIGGRRDGSLRTTHT
jgi:MFS family permease